MLLKMYVAVFFQVIQTYDTTHISFGFRTFGYRCFHREIAFEHQKRAVATVLMATVGILVHHSRKPLSCNSLSDKNICPAVRRRAGIHVYYTFVVPNAYTTLSSFYSFSTNFFSFTPMSI